MALRRYIQPGENIHTLENIPAWGRMVVGGGSCCTECPTVAHSPYSPGGGAWQPPRSLGAPSQGRGRPPSPNREGEAGPGRPAWSTRPASAAQSGRRGRPPRPNPAKGAALSQEGETEEREGGGRPPFPKKGRQRPSSTGRGRPPELEGPACTALRPASVAQKGTRGRPRAPPTGRGRSPFRPPPPQRRPCRPWGGLPGPRSPR